MDEGLICPILFHSYAVYATRGTVTDLAPGRDNVFFYTIGKSLMDIQVPWTSKKKEEATFVASSFCCFDELGGVIDSEAPNSLPSA